MSQEDLLTDSDTSRLGDCCDESLLTPRLTGSPSGRWHEEPASVDEPLLLLDDDQTSEAPSSTVELRPFDELQSRLASEQRYTAMLLSQVQSLQKDLNRQRSLAKLSSSSKSTACADNEGDSIRLEALQEECARLTTTTQRLEDENQDLRTQLGTHHGIMAADWEQSIHFQERLRLKEASNIELEAEVERLRISESAKEEELTRLRADSQNWRILSGLDDLSKASPQALHAIMDQVVANLPRLHAEVGVRRQAAQEALHEHMEQRLCVVCKDQEKSVLFQPCLHVCVCEDCRQLLRPYRCPMCKEPIQDHQGRVHF